MWQVPYISVKTSTIIFSSSFHDLKLMAADERQAKDSRAMW